MSIFRVAPTTARYANTILMKHICAKFHSSRLALIPMRNLLDSSGWDEGLRKVKEEGLASVADSSDPKSILERDGLKWRESLIKTALAEGVRAEDDFDEEAWRKRLREKRL